MLHEDYDRKGSVEKIISGRDPKGAWRQDELTHVTEPIPRQRLDKHVTAKTQQ
jgi:hypothetical protein